MNIINVNIDFTKGINKITGINLITGDYASTKMVFQFDRTDGTKVLEMKSPSGELVYLGEIINNEVVLARVNNGLNYSIFSSEGRYIYEVSLYVDDSKLTSVKGELPVAKEQVIIDGEVVEPYLPLFDELMQDINSAITETNNLNISASKSDHTTTITITNKEGQTSQVEILDGEKGDKGDKGDAGAIKMLIVAELPSTGADDTIYLVPLETPDTSGNNYAEYVYINGAWELLGKIGVQFDASDYYTKTETNTLLNGKANTSDIPTKTSQLTNNSDFTTKSYVDGLVGDIQTLLDNLDTGSGV